MGGWTKYRTTQQTKGAPSGINKPYHIWSTHTQVKTLNQSRTTQHPHWRGGGGMGASGTHHGCGQGRLSNQVGVRNGHAEAQSRAHLLHGRYRRLEVAGQRRGGGGRGGWRVGSLRLKQGEEKKCRIDRRIERVVRVKKRRRGKTGC